MKRADGAGKIIFALLICFIFFYAASGMTAFSRAQAAKQAPNAAKAIEKALSQCYALEGRYPASLEHVQKYGVILDYDAFIYHYEWHGGNLRPTVVVAAR